MHEGNGHSENRNGPVFLTVREVAAVLQVSIACVYAMVAEGKFAVHRVGTGRGSIRVDRSDLEQYLASCREEPIEKSPRPPRTRLKHIRL